MRISDWSSDVCSSDLGRVYRHIHRKGGGGDIAPFSVPRASAAGIGDDLHLLPRRQAAVRRQPVEHLEPLGLIIAVGHAPRETRHRIARSHRHHIDAPRSEEHTSELQSLMRISYAVFCLTK